MHTKSTETRKNYSALLIPILVCLFLLATSVSVVFPQMDVLDSKRLLQILVLPFVFLFALANPSLRRMIKNMLDQAPVMVTTILLVIFLLGCISSSRFPHPAYAFVEVGLLFSLILGVFVIAGARILADQQFDRIVLPLIAAVGAAVLLQETMGLLANWSFGEEFSYEDMFIYFAHPRFFNQLQTWSVPLIASLPVIFKAGRRIQLTTLLLLGVHWYLMLASGARGSVISISFSIILIGILAFPVSRSWLKYNFGGALLGLAGYCLILLSQKLLAGGGEQFLAQSLGRSMTHTTGRTWLWGFAWRDAVQNPFLGSGPSRFACTADVAVPGHPHNIVLQLAGEWGFPTAFLVLGLVIYLAWKILVRIHGARSDQMTNIDTLQLGLAASLVAGAIHSLVSGLFVMPASQVLAMLVGGWLLGLNSRPSQTVLKSRSVIAVLFVGLMMTASIATFGISEKRNMEFRLSDFSDAEHQMPRFWHEGRVCRYTY